MFERRVWRNMYAARLFYLLGLLLLLVLSGCGGQGAASSSSGGTGSSSTSSGAGSSLETSIAIGTHQTGTPYYTVGSGLAKVVSEHTPINMTVRPYTGPAAWLPSLQSGNLELGTLAYYDAYWAYQGEVVYDEAFTNSRLLLEGNRLAINGLVVRKDSGITKTTDLRGKRVAAGWGGAKVNHRIIEAHLATVGMTIDDVVQVPVTDISGAAQLLREKRVDATFGGAPTTASSVELHQAIGLRALNYGDHDPEQMSSFPDEIKNIISEFMPGAVPEVKKAGTGWLEEDSILISYPTLLVASESLSEEAAYQVVKALWENYEELHPINPLLTGWKPETMFTDQPAQPYHPGAIRFFKEQGIWSEAAEANHNALLDLAK